MLRKGFKEREKLFYFGNSKKAFVLLSLIVIAVFLAALILKLAYDASKENSSNYDSFASCLSMKNFVFTGTKWCEGCKKTFMDFNSSFRLIRFKNCELSKAYCASYDITSYPAWVINNTRVVNGYLSMQELSKLSGCTLPDETVNSKENSRQNTKQNSKENTKQNSKENTK